MHDESPLTLAPLPESLVYVLVLNYNSFDDTLACVACVRRSDHSHVRILVIDNASPDGSGLRLAKLLPDHEFLQLPHNTGYAGGNNEGIRRALAAGADHLFIVNPDVRVGPRTVSTCVAAAESAEDVGAINPIQLELDGATIDGKFFRTALRPLGYCSDRYDGTAWPDLIEARDLLGAALFFPRRALETVGGFDPLYFAYGEETDLCRRLRHRGLQLMVTGRAPIRHLRTKEGSGVSDRVLFLRLKGLYLGVLKDPGRSLGSALRTVVRRMLRDLAGRSRAEYPFNQYPVTRRHTMQAITWVLRHLPEVRRHRLLERSGRAYV